MRITVQRDSVTRAQRVFMESADHLDTALDDFNEYMESEFSRLFDRLDRIEKAIADLQTTELKLSALRSKLLGE